MARSKDCPHCDRTLPSSKALEDHVSRSHPDAETPTNWTPILVGAIVVLAAAAVGAALITGGDGGADAAFHIEQSPRTGDDDAPVKFIAFESPACTSCRIFHTRGDPSTYERVLETYAATGKITYVEKFSNAGYGWDRVGAHAQKCAWHLGGWEAFHDLTQAYYTQRSQIDGSNAGTFALDWAQGSSTVNPNAFSDCFEGREHEGDISQDLADGRQAGVRGTPTFIVVAPDGTSQQIVGPQPWSTFQGMIEDALAKAPVDPDAGSNGTDTNGSTRDGDASTRQAGSARAP